MGPVSPFLPPVACRAEQSFSSALYYEDGNTGVSFKKRDKLVGHIRSEGLLKVAEKWTVSEAAIKCFVVQGTSVMHFVV